MLELKQFSTKTLAEKSGIDPKVTLRYCGQLAKAGILSKPFKKPGKDSRNCNFYTLLKPGIHPPVMLKGKIVNPNETPDPMTRIWACMRILKTFDIAELQACAEEANPETIKKYILHLRQTGYLSILARGGRKRTIYKMVKTTIGPIPPVWCVLAGQPGQIFDPNSLQFIDCQSSKLPSKLPS